MEPPPQADREDVEDAVLLRLTPIGVAAGAPALDDLGDAFEPSIAAALGCARVCTKGISAQAVC
jgi:hypothetical protein